MRRAAVLVAALALATAPAAAQQPLPVDQQLASAVLPLPEAQRAGATVKGYRQAGRLETLRQGSNGMICLADAPGDDRFHVACYHESLEAFMARGRALTAQGVMEPQRDSIRAAEAASGALAMPDAPAPLSSLTAEAGAWDADTGTLEGAMPLHVIYMPWTTAETSGFAVTPEAGRPWLMFPGSYRAHLMITPPPPPGG